MWLVGFVAIGFKRAPLGQRFFLEICCYNKIMWVDTFTKRSTFIKNKIVRFGAKDYQPEVSPTKLNFAW